MIPEIILVGVALILGLGAYWSMVIFPRQRDFQKRQRYLRELKVGDEMITYGGIIGRIQSVNEEEGTASVEIADGVTVKMLLAAIIRPYDPDELREAAQKALGKSSDSLDIDHPEALDKTA